MDIRQIFGSSAENLLFEESLSRYTTFRIGGPAEVLATPVTESELERLVAVAHRYGLPVTFLGNASNVLVADKGIQGLVVRLAGLKNLQIAGTTVVAGAGLSLATLAWTAAEKGLSGLEFAGGIPGSLGGATYMNAGAYDGQMSDVIRAVRVLYPNGCWRTLSGDELGFSYRQGVFQDDTACITGVMLQLQRGRVEDIKAKIVELNGKRAAKQPLDLPSAGSMFKRPEGYYAAALIDQCGLKGLSVGGAAVSEKHAGFVVNKGGATAADVLQLVEKIRAIVRQKKGVDLELEVKVLGGSRVR